MPQTPPRSPLTLGKKRRIGELLVEGAIRTMAFASFAAIILIFVFVFREAAPVVFGGGPKGESPTVADTTQTIDTTHTTSSTADTSFSSMKTVGVIKSKEGIKGTDITIKVDASGKKKKLTKNGGNVEQEVYDPFAEETPVDTTKAKAPEKIVPAKKEPKPVATNDTQAVRKNKVYTTTGDGKIEQEVYDPYAEEHGGIAVLPGKKETKSVSTSDTITHTAASDSLAALAAKALSDSLAIKEKQNAEIREHNTDLDNLFFGNTWQPVSTVPRFGFLPLFIGTLKVTLIALLFGAPLAILAALFTSTFAPKWAREILKPVIELLAGFPSVVIGFFALIIMATILQDIMGYQYRLNSFVGGIAMSFAIIPIIYTISEDALTAVPNALRDASTALGATKWQTAFRVILPTAIPGVFAAIILGFGRAFGETMIALMATGNASLSSANPFEPVRTFAATIGAEMAEVVFGDQHYGILFLIGALLFIFTFTLNALVEFYVRKRLIKRIQGK